MLFFMVRGKKGENKIESEKEREKVMKKRVLTWMLAASLSAALLTGCSGSGAKSEENNASEETAEQSEDSNAEENGDAKEDEKKKEQEELEGWIREAVEKLAQEKLWGIKSTTVDIDINGKQKDTTQLERTIDNERQIIKELYHFSTNDQTDFWTREGDKEYQYTEVYTEEGDKEFRKVICDKEETQMYERLKVELLPFDSSLTREVLGCEVKNEGEDGDVIKIKVVEQYKLKPEQFFREMTRESVLKENGWTEDDVKGVEGASEIIDAYVTENDANIEKNKENVYEATFFYWITKEGNELVKSECREQALKIEYEAMDRFYRLSDKINGYGTGRKDSEEEIKIKETVTSKEYVAGDKCAPIEDFPEDAKEITREQYINGEY